MMHIDTYDTTNDTCNTANNAYSTTDYIYNTNFKSTIMCTINFIFIYDSKKIFFSSM